MLADSAKLPSLDWFCLVVVGFLVGSHMAPFPGERFPAHGLFSGA